MRVLTVTVLVAVLAAGCTNSPAMSNHGNRNQAGTVKPS